MWNVFHILLFYSPSEGHLGCFQVLAIMNKAAINICVQFFCVNIVFNFFGQIPRSKLFSKVVVSFCIPTSCK